MFLGLPDSDPSLLCTDPDPSINKKKSKKNLNFYYFMTSFRLLSIKTDVNVPSKSNKENKLKKNNFCLHLVSH
jgi:hypothetical protein